MLFKFDSHPSPGLYEDGRLVTTEGTATSTVRSKKIVTANSGMGGGMGGGVGAGGGGFGIGSGGDGGGSGTSFSGGGSAPASELYNPVRDRLDEGSVVEDWIPRDASGLDEMFRLMYHRDHISGTIVDMLAELIWSEYDLIGIKDPVVKNIFQDCMEALNVGATFPGLTREFLVIGRSISSLIFDPKKGYFKDVISHDPSLVRLTPIPIKGFDPKIDLIPSPSMRRFVESIDPRDVDARKVLPAAFIEAVKKASGGSGRGLYQAPIGGHSQSTGYGGIPLDPINTLFIARRVFNHDPIGTSFLTRIITFWALEKALINATVTSARRRSRSILHVKAGIDNLWEPSPQELDNIAGMFIVADQDPVGAVVATRTGVDTSEVRSGNDFYKWSDEWALLNEGKLRALGANDALLTGDATYSNQESARMFFMERALNLRNTLTSRILYDRIFPLLARIHGIRKVTQAELSHGIRIGGTLTQRQALEIPDSELQIPTVQWRKELINQVDEKRLEIFDKAEEKGIPVTLRSWAAAGNIDLDSMVSDMQTDADLRKQINRWRKSFEQEDEFAQEEAKLEFIRELRQAAHSSVKHALGSKFNSNILGPIGMYPFWSKEGTIGQLQAVALAEFLQSIDPGNNSVGLLGDPAALRVRLIQHFHQPELAEIAHFLMFRTKLVAFPPQMSGKAIAQLAEHIKTVLDQHSANGNVYQLGVVAQGELQAVAAMAPKRHSTTGSSSSSGQINMSRKKTEADVKQKLNGSGRSFDGIADNSPKLYSGT